jgi:hypothetical protein
MQRKTGLAPAIVVGMPAICAAKKDDGSKIVIKRGEMGYIPVPNDFDVVKYNRLLNVTAPQVEAMLLGSMFGFDCPGADPNKHSGAQAKDWV